MCVKEQGSTCGKPVEVWGLCLRMPAKAANPVVEVIDRYEQNIRLLSLD